MIAIFTRYLPPTDSQGAQIKAYASGRRQVTIDYPKDAYGPVQAHYKAVKAFCHEYVAYASLWDMRYGDTIDGRGFVFCFSASIVPNNSKKMLDKQADTE